MDGKQKRIRTNVGKTFVEQHLFPFLERLEAQVSSAKQVIAKHEAKQSMPEEFLRELEAARAVVASAAKQLDSLANVYLLALELKVKYTAPVEKELKRERDLDQDSLDTLNNQRQLHERGLLFFEAEADDRLAILNAHAVKLHGLLDRERRKHFELFEKKEGDRDDPKDRQIDQLPVNNSILGVLTVFEKALFLPHLGRTAYTPDLYTAVYNQSEEPDYSSYKVSYKDFLTKIPFDLFCMGLYDSQTRMGIDVQKITRSFGVRAKFTAIRDETQRDMTLVNETLLAAFGSNPAPTEDPGMERAMAALLRKMENQTSLEQKTAKIEGEFAQVLKERDRLLLDNKEKADSLLKLSAEKAGLDTLNQRLEVALAALESGNGSDKDAKIRNQIELEVRNEFLVAENQKLQAKIRELEQSNLDVRVQAGVAEAVQPLTQHALEGWRNTQAVPSSTASDDEELGDDAHDDLLRGVIANGAQLSDDEGGPRLRKPVTRSQFLDEQHLKGNAAVKAASELTHK